MSSKETMHNETAKRLLCRLARIKAAIDMSLPRFPGEEVFPPSWDEVWEIMQSVRKQGRILHRKLSEGKAPPKALYHLERLDTALDTEEQLWKIQVDKVLEALNGALGLLKGSKDQLLRMRSMYAKDLAAAGIDAKQLKELFAVWKTLK